MFSHHLPRHPIVITYLGTISFEIRGQRIDEEFSQRLADLARELALHPEKRELVDIETMTIREEEDSHEENG